MSKIGSRIQVIQVAWIVLLCAFLSGCLAAPIRAPTKTRNTSGALGKKLDLGFIQVGTTTREEVRQKLGWIDTGVTDDRLFLGRWADSSWGVAWAAGGEYAAAGGWNRVWKTHNLVLDFDEKGIVQQMSIVPDNDILRTLSEQVSKEPTRSLNLSTPIELPVEYIRQGKRFLGTLVLGKDTFQFLEDRERGEESYDFKTSPENVSHLSMYLPHKPVEVAWDRLHPGNVVVTIHFKKSTSVGSKMNVRVDLPTTMILVKYIAQIQQGSAARSEKPLCPFWYPKQRVSAYSVRRILLLPPRVAAKAEKEYGKGFLDSPGTSEYVANAASGTILRVLEEKGVEVDSVEDVGDTETSAALTEIEDRFESLVKLARERRLEEIKEAAAPDTSVRPQAEPMEGFEVREAVAKLTRGKAPDALLLTYGEFWSQPEEPQPQKLMKTLAAGLAGVPYLGDWKLPFGGLGLVDRRRGTLIFFSACWLCGPGDSQCVTKPVEESLTNFFGEPGAGKPTSSRPK